MEKAMNRRYYWVMAATAAMVVTTFAGTPNPPAGNFKKVGQLYMERNAGDQAATDYKQLRFSADPGFTLDTSYHQPAANFAGGDKDKATSPLGPANIPGGVYIEPGGGWYWSIQGPLQLFGNTDDLGEDGRIKSYTFGANLYCGPEPKGGPGCNSHIDVWVKQKPIAKKASTKPHN
jgi:hypothetical protein